MPVIRAFPVALLSVLVCACQSAPMRSSPPAAGPDKQRLWFDGEYSNHEQVTQAGTTVVPRVRIVIAPLRKTGWYSWNIHMSAASDFSAIWAVRSDKSANGSMVLTPFRPLVAAPKLAADFDLDEWVALDACALKGNADAQGFVVKADPASCAILIPGIGANAALLPLEIVQDNEWLRVRLYSDQARGPDARIDARRLRWFSGWAAVNGAGQNATVDSNDWHMTRDIRIDNEGGNTQLTWRDGKPTGYSLVLERMTYRDGNVPVLKLSIVEDASGRSLAYAWANPEANRIGINLGWLQVGLEVGGLRAEQ